MPQFDQTIFFLEILWVGFIFCSFYFFFFFFNKKDMLRNFFIKTQWVFYLYNLQHHLKLEAQLMFWLLIGVYSFAFDQKFFNCLLITSAVIRKTNSPRLVRILTRLY